MMPAAAEPKRRFRRLPFYMFGAFGRVLCLAGVATLVALAGDSAGTFAIAGFFVLWTIYAFVSGVVAVPYNDIVARSIESGKRSRMLALRFFGGGLLALGVAAIAGRLLEVLTFSEGYAAILIVGALLLLISTLSFVSAGEPQTPLPAEHTGGFVEFLKSGVEVFRRDQRFRLFLYSRWAAGMVAMALPFYILQVIAVQASSSQVAFLLGAQTTGALLSNPLWGWWGDVRGKHSLLEGVAVIGALAPLLQFFLVRRLRNVPIKESYP
ncbi:MFS transporter [Marinobacter antarcticus]|nr:MFS transporter [Marinobacter antarcticus]